jgi:hypothetical protein
MWRYLVGVLAGVLLVAGGVLWWRNAAVAHRTLPDLPAAANGAAESGEAMPEPPAASEKTREEKRLSRIDHDKNGEVSRDEFLAARKRNFAKLDVNADGKLSFEEYASKGVERFAAADKDKSGALNAAEFATTRAARTAKPTCRCADLPAAKGDEEN